MRMPFLPLLALALLAHASCSTASHPRRGARDEPLPQIALGPLTLQGWPDLQGGFDGTPATVAHGATLTIRYDPQGGSVTKIQASRMDGGGPAEETIEHLVTDGSSLVRDWIPPMEWKTFKLKAGSDEHVVTATGEVDDRFEGTPYFAVSRKPFDLRLRLPGESAATVVILVDPPAAAGNDGGRLVLDRGQADVYVLNDWRPSGDTKTPLTLRHRDSAPHVIQFRDQLPDLFQDTTDKHPRGKDITVKFDAPPLPEDVGVTMEYGIGGLEQKKPLELKPVAGSPGKYQSEQAVPYEWEYLRLVATSSASHMVALIDADRHAADYADKYFLLHTGVVSLSPFRISTVQNADPELNTHSLDQSSSAATAGYVEALFRHRKAWLTTDQEFPALRERHWYKPDDIELRLGSTFAGDSTASSIAGSGDFYSEASLGWSVPGPTPERVGTEGAYALNVEFMGGLTTDRSIQDVHGYYMAGPNLVVGIPFSAPNSGTTPRMIEMQLGLYYGWADFPEFVTPTSAGIRNKRGFPEFEQEESLGMRADFRLPIGESGYVVFTARAFDQLGVHDIKPWSLMIGVTVPIKSIGTAVFGSTPR